MSADGCVEPLDIPPDSPVYRNRPLRPATEADRHQMITYFKMLVDETMHGSPGKMKQFVGLVHPWNPGGNATRAAMTRIPVRPFSTAWNASLKSC